MLRLGLPQTLGQLPWLESSCALSLPPVEFLGAFLFRHHEPPIFRSEMYDNVKEFQHKFFTTLCLGCYALKCAKNISVPKNRYYNYIIYSFVIVILETGWNEKRCCFGNLLHLRGLTLETHRFVLSLTSDTLSPQQSRVNLRSFGESGSHVSC